jgi:GTP-binding protein
MTTTQQVRKRPQPVFLMSAAFSKEFPETSDDEFAILGRSNVGKSSFINHVLERQGLARTSRTPGKTSLANFYRIGEGMVWVDLPGYGYAKVAATERERWSQLIRDYCEKRENLRGIIWLIDIRHPGVKADLEAREWLDTIDCPVLPILTKLDKVTKNEAHSLKHKAIKTLRLATEPISYSVLQHVSRERFWESFDLWRGEWKV